MSPINSDNHRNWLDDGNYITKANWQSYVDNNHRENSYEFLGYLDATKGIIQNLNQVLLESDPEKLRMLLATLVLNRQDLVDHAESILDLEWSKMMPNQ